MLSLRLQDVTTVVYTGGAIPAVIGREAGYTLDRLPGPHRDKRDKQPHTRSLLRTILETPIDLTCMFLDGGRKPEYPERTHAYTGRTCKLHTERPQLGV